MDIILSPRLLAVAKEIKRCGTVADIGTDHAYLAVYAVKKGIADKAYATDIAEGPIKIAKKNIVKYGVADRVETIVCDGLMEVPECETVVIAGMGGQMIAHILESSPKKAKSCKRLILQPMTFSHELREYLYKNGYTITDETVAEDNGKIYMIITAVPEPTSDVPKRYYYIGKKLIEKKEPLTYEYIKRKTESLKKALSQMKNSEGTEQKEKELTELLHIYNECEQEMRE